MQIDLSKRRIQKMAASLRACAPESTRPSHAQALDTIAQMLGYKTYTRLKPLLETQADGDPREPTTVILYDGLADAYVTRVVDEQETEHAWREAQTMLACEKLGLSHEGDDAPADPESEQAYLDTLNEIAPCMVLRGTFPEIQEGLDRMYSWTAVIHDPSVVVDGYLDGYALVHVQARERAIAEHLALNDYVAARKAETDVQRDDLSVAFLAPGYLVPLGEPIPGEGEHRDPAVVIEMRGGVIQQITADQGLRIMIADYDELEEVACDAGAEQDAYADLMPDWSHRPSLRRPACLTRHAERVQESFDARLRQALDLDD